MAGDSTMLGALALLGTRWQAALGTGCNGVLDESSRQFVFTIPSARIRLATGMSIWRSLPQQAQDKPTGLEIACQTPPSALQLLEVASGSAPHLLSRPLKKT